MAWGALAAIKNEIPALVFVVNDTHLAIATYMVDMHLAIEMQANAEIQRKHGAAHRGSDHGSDDGDDGYDDDVPNRKRKARRFRLACTSQSSEEQEDETMTLDAVANVIDQDC